jgi:hypothetical protein
LSFLGLNFAKLNSTIERGSIRTREGIGLMVAGESGLIKDGLVAADETPVSSLNDSASIVLNGQADVEDLAVVVDISVIAVSLSSTAEARLQLGLEKGLSISWEGVRQGIGRGLWGRADERSHDGEGGNEGGDGGENNGLHGGGKEKDWELRLQQRREKK